MKSNHGIQRLYYGTEEFPFQGDVCSALGVADLGALHKIYATSDYGDAVIQLRHKCEEMLGSDWGTLNRFISEKLEPLCGPVLARQATATFRFHFALGDTAAPGQATLHRQGAYRDLLKRYYGRSLGRVFHRDGDFRVDKRAINLWLPLTELNSANTLWVGGNNLAPDAIPLHLSVGQCALFNAITRWHGAVINCSETTRVSFDLRLVFREETSAVLALRAFQNEQ
ncbi:hypothetical protein IVB25_00165 [Bradyrhizobium sp. 193]|uniref:hypothetical protein n=1 Tax=unclassified Bradyrhizobium TaxID=2631580 RepID=UPI001FF7AC2D|nr:MULTISPECIES: hypothetical protein [unclassified Bradyrhizobium]MCK1466847.1 hypothetical protein [Bradyrhizobium sp. CW10]MCK1481223.1 hypothetical protein [Bradyrhizobium sp. 193]